MSFGEFLEEAGDFLLEQVPVVGKIYTGIKLANAEDRIDELENSLTITKVALLISFVLNILAAFAIVFLLNGDDNSYLPVFNQYPPNFVLSSWRN
ncbi:hypothetical protein CKO12_02685 [Chromatium okenii]|uniref:hypothetical protein n=1 Tax=Chromatium okenii TaxID=61644 RepID=UPI001903DD47|nr:hypothetical protein [Chromatium okenii]MBK1640803.1 hypothetical protein [Chromatium okenii]